MSPHASREPVWEELRSEMPIVENWAYFDHAAVAPISGPAQRAIHDWSNEAATQGDTVWPRWAARIEQIRATAAKLICAQDEEVALVPNTTAGIGLIAEGFPWREGDNVVIVAGEFPSNLYPWMNLRSRGVEPRTVQLSGIEVELDQILGACDSRTRMIAISWVGFASGWRIDVDELVAGAHRLGVLVSLDAIQGLGVFPISVRRSGLDFLAADGHKWLLGPEGAGILYVRRDHLDRLRPLNVGWNSVQHFHDFDRIELSVRDSAARYEGGSQNMAGFFGLGASLDLLVRFGAAADVSPIADRVLQVCRSAAERLESIGARIHSTRDSQHASGIITFALPGSDPAAVRRQCLRAGVALSVRSGRLRISPHAYTDETDIDRLIAAVRA